MVIITHISPFVPWCGVVMSSGACPNMQGLACLSQTNALLVDGLHCCLLYWWSCQGQLWYLGTFTPFHTTRPLAVFKQLSPFFMLCTRYKMCSVQYGGSVCVSGCHVLPIPPLLTCFLSLLLFTSCSLMETSRAKLKFSWGSQETQRYMPVRLALLLRRGRCMGFLAIVLRRLWACCFFLHGPLRHRCFGRLMSPEVWSRTRWLLLYMKTQYLWQLNSNQ